MASVRLDSLTVAELTGCRRGGEIEDGRPPVRSDVSLGSILDSEKEIDSACSSIISDELGEIDFTDDEYDFADEDRLIRIHTAGTGTGLPGPESPEKEGNKSGGHGEVAAGGRGPWRNGDFRRSALHSPSHSQNVVDGPPGIGATTAVSPSLSAPGQRRSTKTAAPIIDAASILSQTCSYSPQVHSQTPKEDDSNNRQALVRPGAGSSIASTEITGNDVSGGVSPQPTLAAIPTVTCKILVVGNAKCGKSSIISRFVNDRFAANYSSTVGVDYAMKDVPLGDGHQIRLQLWDIAGQDRFAKLTRAYFRRAKGAVVVCDVTREGTFNAIVKWKEEIDLWCHNERYDLPVYLFANKCDLLTEAEESFLAGARMEKTCREAGFTAWYATSAKRGDNIPQAMTKLLQDALEMELLRNRGSLAGEGQLTRNRSGSTQESSRGAFRLSSCEALDGGKRLAQQACCT